ncbi:hypothetical protein [Brevibacillus laterosporus]|nr:hypothetical protein [Brevibacillus laterosporus]MBM7111878.1 hypothetical protein [Brevibacillus laterosporus]
MNKRIAKWTSKYLQSTAKIFAVSYKALIGAPEVPSELIKK